MKRSILSMAAIAIAVLGAAFTAPTNNKFADSYFEFNSSAYAPTQANVEDESKWVKVTDMGSCDENLGQACRIQVTSSHVSGTTLLPNTNILATISAPGIAFVSSAQAVQIRNKQ